MENDPSSARTNTNDHQHLITLFHDKQQQYVQQVRNEIDRHYLFRLVDTLK